MAIGGAVSLRTERGRNIAPGTGRRPGWGSLYAILPITALCGAIGYRLEAAGGSGPLLQAVVVLLVMAFLLAWTRAKRRFLLGQPAEVSRPPFSVVRIRLSSRPPRRRSLPALWLAPRRGRPSHRQPAAGRP